MQLDLPSSIDKKEALRYMGGSGWTPDSATTALLTTTDEQLLPACPPRGVWRELPFAAMPLEAAGTDLARHLSGCDHMILMAVTLGSRVDALMRRLCFADIARGAAADALASALIETLCNDFEKTIRADITGRGLYMTGRYSPGYGDCPLELQDALCLALDTVRGIGAGVTAEHLLTPRKTVTAILGVADTPVTGALAGCGHCLLQTKCAYRKRGTTCASK